MTYYKIPLSQMSATDLLREAADAAESVTCYRIDRGGPFAAEAIHFPTGQCLGIAWGADADYYRCPTVNDVEAAINRWIAGDEPDA